MIILEALQMHATEMPQKVAVIDGGSEISYFQLWQNILKAASFYETIGNRGDRVILLASKSVDFVYSYFGAQLAGLTTVSVDSAVNSIRFKRITESAKQIGIYGTLYLENEDYEVKPFPDLENVQLPNKDYSFPDESENADILFTTGTTGFPKGVVLTHYNEFCAASMINEFIRNTSEDIEILALPISHSFGLGRLRCTILKGGTIDLLGSFTNMKKFFREVEKHHITGFGMVPASWNYIKRMSGEKIGGYANQLKYIEIGSAPMKIEDKELLLKLFPKTRVCMHYGLTEASRSAFICFNDSRAHLNSIGHPSPNVEIKIFDESGIEVKRGDQGEICVKGGHVCSAYWGDSAERYADSFYGDYFRTGDWGYEDEDGYYYLISRQKELINVGGKKLSPIEVEEVINAVPGVEESACIGIPDDIMGEVVKAFVVRNDESVSEDMIISETKRRLEGYKVPVAVAFIKEVPKTSSGKVQRLLLK